MKSKINLSKIISVVIINLVIAAVFLAFGSQKQSLHMDEMYTFALANGDVFDIFDESMQTYTGDEMMKQYMTVSEGEAFNFVKVYKNQIADVHPPLYYMFVHFFSSFAPGVYSRLMGLIPNIIFAVIVYWQMVWLFGQFSSKRIVAMIFAGLYLFTMCFVNNVMFFRMYVLLTVMTNFLIMLFVRYKPWQDRTKWFYIGLFFTIIGGMLTQYYFSIIAAFVCLVYAVYLAYYKQVRDLVKYVITGLAGVAASIAIFPAALQHIFFGYRGEEAFESFATANLKSNVSAFFDILNYQVFGNMFILLVAVILVVWLLSEHTSGEVDEKIKHTLLQILLPTIIYVCFIAKVAPYQTDRYVANISGILYLSIFGILLLITEKYAKKGFVLSFVLAAIVLIGSYQNGVSYLFKYTESRNNEIEQISDIPCVCIWDTSAWRCVSYYMEIMRFDNVTFIAERDGEFVDNWQYKENDKLVVYLDTVSGDTWILDRIVENNPNIEGYSKLYTTDGAQVYLLD